MEQDKNNNFLLLVSWLGAYVSIGSAQQIVSLLSGLVAIGSGASAIRYYYIKSKIEKND